MPLNRKMIIDPRKPEPNWLQDDAGSWMQFNVTNKNFPGAATTSDFDLTGFPAGAIIVGAFIRARANFTGGGVGTATLSLGTTASPAAYVAAVSVFSGSPKTLPGTTLVPGTFVNATTPTAAGTIRARLTVDTTTGVLTAGSADIFIWLTAMKLYSGG